MKLALLAVAVTVAVVAGGGTAGASGAADAFSCKVKRFKVDGLPAVTGCGPATVELKVSGTSYAFRNGVCKVRGTGSSRTLVLELGTTVLDPKTENHGYPFFSITMTTAITGSAVIVGVYRSELVTGFPGPVLAPVRFRGKYAGTFSYHGAETFSGSWNCHGVST